MKIVLAISALLSMFVISSIGWEKEQEQVAKFLSQQSTPLVEYEAFRRMEARNAKGEVDAWLELNAKLSQGNSLQYQVLNSYKSSNKASGKVYNSFFTLLEREIEHWKTGSFKKSGFLTDNYTFFKTEDLGGVYQLSLKAKRKEGLLINGMIFVSPEGKLLRSEGVLTKNPSPWFSRVLVIITYREIYGVTVPSHYDSEARVRIFGEWTTDVSYKYKSINGLPVTEN